jgi:hypothetical protein
MLLAGCSEAPAPTPAPVPATATAAAPQTAPVASGPAHTPKLDLAIIPDSNHWSIVAQMATSRDAVTPLLAGFVRRVTAS